MESISTLAPETVNPSSTADRISFYYLELERLLDRVERSTTHYQALALDRSATDREVRLAYQQALILLHPPDEIKATMPNYIFERLERAFETLYSAYSVMVNFGKRVEYDNSLLPRFIRAVPIDIPTRFPSVSEHRLTKAAYRLKALETRSDNHHNPARREERRRSDRYTLRIPARVTGFDRINGMWSDVTETIDVSSYGVAIQLGRNLPFGGVIHLCLPMPDILRNYGHLEPEYGIYAVVRRLEPPKDGVRRIGLEFIGGDAPDGFSESPWAAFNIGSWNGPERRREQRLDRSEVVAVEYLNEELKHIRQEVAVTENLSPGGARVFLKSAPSNVNLVRITNLDRSFESRATICNRYVGNDGFERLCVRFLDARWPV